MPILFIQFPPFLNGWYELPPALWIASCFSWRITNSIPFIGFSQILSLLIIWLKPWFYIHYFMNGLKPNPIHGGYITFIIPSINATSSSLSPYLAYSWRSISFEFLWIASSFSWRIKNSSSYVGFSQILSFLIIWLKPILIIHYFYEWHKCQSYSFEWAKAQSYSSHPITFIIPSCRPPSPPGHRLE